jgi:hypothetical protein
MPTIKSRLTSTPEAALCHSPMAMSSVIGKYFALRINSYRLSDLNWLINLLCILSYILVPGMTILPRGVLAIIYGVFLCYIFVGLFVISDVMHS